MRGGRAAEFVALLILAVGVWLGFATAGLPPVAPASAPATTFSAGRAMADLRVIAAAPHPIGSANHDRLRDFLVDRLRALGLADVHVQSAVGFNTLDGPLAATVANVVGRRRGTRPGPAILLTAHYDAVPRSFGAGDDGIGVAAILETLRALQAMPPLERDIVVVFSDAEESGLLGAEAFVDLHPWAKDIGVVLNFEGRGDAGPVFMFQTSNGNGPLIAALARTATHVRANSLTGEVYRHLHSDTDLSVWLYERPDVGALNFADVGGYTHYHTPLDNIGSLDERVLQHTGEYALSLATALGHADLGRLHGVDDVYFNAPLFGLVHYPGAMALPAAIVVLLLVAAWMVLAARRKLLSGRGVARGALVMLGALAVPCVITALGWLLVNAAHPAYADILQGDPYNSLAYLLSVSAMTVAVVMTLQLRTGPRASTTELAVVSFALWAVLGVVVALTLPGATYLLLWPLLGALGAAALLLRATDRPATPIIAALLALPALALWPPLIQSLEVALTARRLVFCSLLAALVTMLLVVPLQLLGDWRRRAIGMTALLAVGALLAAELTAGSTATRPHPDSLAYLRDADSGRAWWVSFDRRPDAWTSLALGAHPARRSFAAMHLGLPADAFWSTPALVGEAAPDPIRVLAATPEGSARRIHLHIDRTGDIENLTIQALNDVVVSEVVVNGRRLADGSANPYAPGYRAVPGKPMLRYWGVNEDGVDLWFTLHSSAPVTLQVLAAVEGLPPAATGPLPARPAAMMSKPFIPTDVTMNRWTVSP